MALLGLPPLPASHYLRFDVAGHGFLAFNDQNRRFYTHYVPIRDKTTNFVNIIRHNVQKLVQLTNAYNILICNLSVTIIITMKFLYKNQFFGVNTIKQSICNIPWKFQHNRSRKSEVMAFFREKTKCVQHSAKHCT